VIHAPTVVIFLAVCILDVMAGDPRWVPHPVRGMGLFIRLYERLTFARLSGPLAMRAAGLVLAVGLPLGCFVITTEIVNQAQQIHHMLGVVTWVVLGYTTLAGRDLWDHALRVYQALTHGALVSARAAVGGLVGRDTAALSEEDIVRATVESVSENTSDGIVAPLVYLALGGPALAMAYKAINTLDSMVGYRTERYCEFGWASARLDDAANWVPARLTAVAMSVAATFRAGTGLASWRMCWRDARQHPSPNSGWPEAAMAGALGIQLGGANVYGGVTEQRPRLGDPVVTCGVAHIRVAMEIMALACVLLVCVLVGGLVLSGWM
jgi:adenosylcobinamide-phosphate synthase